MDEKDLKELKNAYEEVFNESGETKLCGREACAHLITLMKKHTNADVGQEKKGWMNPKVLQAEYRKLIG